MYVVCVSYVKDCNSQPDEWHRFDTKFDMIKCICTDKENIGNQIILQKYLRALWYDQAQHRWVTSELWAQSQTELTFNTPALLFNQTPNWISNIQMEIWIFLYQTFD